MRNFDLHKYRTGSVIHGDTQPAVAHLVAITLLRSLGTLCKPLGRLLAAYLWAGRSVLGVVAYLERLVLHLVGWLSGTAFHRRHYFNRLSRHYFDVNVRRWHVGVAAIIAGGAATALVQRVRNSFDDRLRRRAEFEALMAAAPSYDQWRQLATQLKQLEASESQAEGKAAPPPPYDRKLLHEKCKHLRHVRLSGNVKEMMFALRLDLVRNIANIAKCNLQDRCATIPDPIQRYLAEVKENLAQIRDWPEHELPTSEKLAFFRETRHAFGRTALLLSGGGSYGTYHMGVCKALFDQHILPRVLAGSSAGAIVCAIVATRTDVELKDHFDNINHFGFDFYHNNHAGAMVHQILRKGSLQDMAHLIKKLRVLLGDLTFLEAYERTGRILNVSVCPADTNEPARLLNYLTAPHALVWSAVAASSAFPGLFPPQHLLARNSNGEIVTFSAQCGDSSMERRWRDGSLELDLPAQALGEMFNCNHYIVGQTNPHIVPLLNLKHFIARRVSRKWANIVEAELKHRCQVLQWLLPDWMDSVSRFLTLFTQPWEGDITMVLPMDITLQLSPLVNPTRVDLIRLLKVGEVATWQKLSSIECNCTIEATLDSCMASISNRARGRPTGYMHTRIPSWLHMPGLGLPIVASWGDNMYAAVEAGNMERAASWGENQNQEHGTSNGHQIAPWQPQPARPAGAWPSHQALHPMVEGMPVRMMSAAGNGALMAPSNGVAEGKKISADLESAQSCASSLTLGQQGPTARSSLEAQHLEQILGGSSSSSPSLPSPRSSGSYDEQERQLLSSRASSMGMEVPGAAALAPQLAMMQVQSGGSSSSRQRQRRQPRGDRQQHSDGEAARVGRARRQRGGNSAAPHRLAAQGKVTEQEMLAMAQMDCTDASVDDSLWGSLLPLTGLGQRPLGPLVRPASGTRIDSGDAIDVFAY